MEGEKENVTVYWWFGDWRHIWCCANVPVTDYQDRVVRKKGDIKMQVEVSVKNKKKAEKRYQEYVKRLNKKRGEKKKW